MPRKARNVRTAAPNPPPTSAEEQFARLKAAIQQMEPSRNSIEERLDSLVNGSRHGIRSILLTEIIDKNAFDAATNSIEYWRYVQVAQQHYFIARVLFLNHVTEYSLFCAQQCAENYLKGYLKANNSVPPKHHHLLGLLKDCIACALPEHAFIREDRLRFLLERYDPFYELARYPVQNSRPSGGSYGLIVPYDIYLLDYFVLRMRELLPIPDNTWDIFRDGLMTLESTRNNSPEFYSFLHLYNINFPTENSQP